MKVPPIAFRFFENFQGRQTLIFSGDSNLLSDFSVFLKEFSKECADLESINSIVNKGNQHLILQITSSPFGMFKGQSSSDRGELFEWRLSAALAEKFSELIKIVANNSQPSHHYLDSDAPNSITVIVSKGEYRDLLAL